MGCRRTALLIAGLVLMTALPAAARWARYAVVVGWNDSDDSALARLKYADDDAVKHAQLLTQMTERTILLTRLDDDSRRTFGPLPARAPTRANVMAALREVREQMAADRAKGLKPVLYFVYSGHGNYDQEGRGYVHLMDGRLTTRDLYFDVLGPTEGDEPHHLVLMVDACNAALLVNSRGSDRRRAQQTSLKLENYPNVGVVLSASSVGEVHEWGKLLSGIFSHELRSAMLGAGDLNDDGELSFPELAAFIASANAEVKNEVYRLKPYIRPPLSAPNMPLASLNDARFPARVRVDGSVTGRGHLVNHELLRYADFHKSPDHAFWLALPGTEGFVIVADGQEFQIPEGATGDLTLADLSARPQSVISQRGAHEYFEERLFARVHAPADANRWLRERYRESLVVERFEAVPWYENTGAWSLLGGSVASLAAAGVLHGLSTQAFDSLAARPGDYYYAEADRMRGDAGSQRDAAIALYSIGAAGALASTLWFVLDRRYERTTYEPPLEVDVSPTGVQLRTSF